MKVVNVRLAEEVVEVLAEEEVLDGEVGKEVKEVTTYDSWERPL